MEPLESRGGRNFFPDNLSNELSILEGENETPG